MCFNLVRTNAPPLPGLTCWKSTMLYGSPSNSILRAFLNSAVDTCIGLWPFPSLSLEPERFVEPLPRPGVVRVLLVEAHADRRGFVHPHLVAATAAGAR